jgi:hypothetical protein
MELMELIQMAKALKELDAPTAAPAPAAPVAAPTLVVEGPIRRFKSGALLGDLRVQTLPRGIAWRVRDGKSKSLESPTVWRGNAHIGPHGRAWVTDLVDTGVPYAAATASDDADFEAALAAAEGAAADATTAEDAPTV